jgi:hypothetical protein
VLLPITLVKFQVPNDVSRTDLDVKYRTPGTSRNPASKSYISPATPDMVDTLTKANNDGNERGAVSFESVALAAGSELETSVISMSSTGPEVDELEKIVSEVKETADLVISHFPNSCLVTQLTVFSASRLR